MPVFLAHHHTHEIIIDGKFRMSAGALPADIVFHQAILYEISYSAILNVEVQGRYSGSILTSSKYFKAHSSGAV